MPGSEKQNSMFKKTKGYVQERNPFAVTSCGRRRNDGSPLFAKAEPRRTIGKGKKELITVITPSGEKNFEIKEIKYI